MIQAIYTIYLAALAMYDFKMFLTFTICYSIAELFRFFFITGTKYDITIAKQFNKEIK